MKSLWQWSLWCGAENKRSSLPQKCFVAIEEKRSTAAVRQTATANEEWCRVVTQPESTCSASWGITCVERTAPPVVANNPALGAPMGSQGEVRHFTG